MSKHVEQHGQSFKINMAMPKKLRPIVIKSRLQQPPGEVNQKLAERLALPHLQRFYSILEQAEKQLTGNFSFDEEAMRDRLHPPTGTVADMLGMMTGAEPNPISVICRSVRPSFRMPMPVMLVLHV